MKAWENLKQYETGILINMGVSPDDKLYFHDALEQALTDLIKMRKNKGMTIRYFNTALTTDQRRNEHVRRIGEAKGLYDVEYHGYPKEWKLSDGIGHDALKYIIKDDKYSFGYLYKELMSEEQGYEVMGFDDEVIMYAIDFDIDEVQKALSEISSSEEKVTYLIGKKTQSQLVLCPNEDSVLGQLKHAYESQIQILLEAEKEMMALKRFEKVTPEPIIEEPKSVENTYLFYNPEIIKKGAFTAKDCANPMTFEFVRRCSANNSMLKEFISDHFGNCYRGTTDGIGWNDTQNELCSNILSSLLKEYLQRLKSLCYGDAYEPLESGARWLYHTIKIVDEVYDECPEIEVSNFEEALEYPRRFIQSTIEFKRYLISSLTHFYICEVFFEQYNIEDHRDIYTHTILYNLWGEVYLNEYERKKKEIGLIDEDRAKIYKDANIDWFTAVVNKYAKQYISSDGQTYIEQDVYSDPKDFSQEIQKLFADYVRRIRAQIQPCDELKQILVQWCFETIERFLQIQEKLSRIYRNDEEYFLNEFMVDYCVRPVVNIFNNFQKDISRQSFLNYYPTYQDANAAAHEQSQQNVDGERVTAPEEKDALTIFKDCILKSVETVFPFLDSSIKKSKKKKAVMFIRAAIEAEVMIKPDFLVVEQLYPNVGCKSYYNKLVKPSAYTKEELAPIISTLLELVKEGEKSSQE